MKNFHNIEKTASHHIFYTGYGAETVWKIYGKTGCWTAYPNDREKCRSVICEPTLEKVSIRLQKVTA